MPKVSVIIPNYNHAHFLEQRILSVLGQTFQDFEVILLDDASSDGSREVMDRYRAHSKVAHIEYNAANSGSPFAQWNKGVGLARGEFVWIAESDDYADSRFLEHMVPSLDADPGIGLVNCQSWVVDCDGQVTGLHHLYRGNSRWTQDYRYSGKQECGEFLVHACTIPNASAVLFRRSAYLEAGQADVSYCQCGDWLMWARILMLHDIGFVATPLNYFRLHGENPTLKNWGSPLQFIEELEVVGHILGMGAVPPSVPPAVVNAFVEKYCRVCAYYAEEPVARGPAGARILDQVRRSSQANLEREGDTWYRQGDFEKARRLYSRATRWGHAALSCRVKRGLMWLGVPGVWVRKVVSLKNPGGAAKTKNPPLPPPRMGII